MKYLDGDGNMYEGEWKNGERYGKGKEIKSDGAILEGEWKFGKPHGKVKYRNSKGDFYFGDYKNGMRNGKGVYLFSNGEIYSGEFRNGIPNGKGIDFYSNGDAYCGQFVNEKRNGKGMYFYSGGRIYSGEFREAMPNGKGILLYPNGNIYSGLFKNDKSHGSGRMYYPNGYVQDNYSLFDSSNYVSDITINEEISVDMRVIFERENIIIKLINDFHFRNGEIFDILKKKLEENMNNSKNLKNIFNNMYFEEIIFNLLSDINKVGKSSILTSLISKRTSNLYFSPHIVLLYGYYPEIERRGIIIINSLFLFLFIFFFYLCCFNIENRKDYSYQIVMIYTLENSKMKK
jgi:hypothetical protein